MTGWTTQLRTIAIVLGLTAILAAFGYGYALTWHPSLATYPIQGTDLSDANGDVDFHVLKASGADFVYLRATYGADGRDARFAEHWPAAKEAEMRRGALHVYSFCRLAADQANNFITTVPRTADALPAVLAIDFSEDCPDRPAKAVAVAEIGQFLKMVETHTGTPLLLKVSAAVEKEYGISTAIPRTVWNARFFFAPSYSTRPWRMWQASSFRHVDGVSTPINWDVVAP